MASESSLPVSFARATCLGGDKLSSKSLSRSRTLRFVFWAARETWRQTFEALLPGFRYLTVQDLISHQFRFQFRAEASNPNFLFGDNTSLQDSNRNRRRHQSRSQPTFGVKLNFRRLRRRIDAADSTRQPCIGLTLTFNPSAQVLTNPRSRINLAYVAHSTSPFRTCGSVVFTTFRQNAISLLLIRCSSNLQFLF